MLRSIALAAPPPTHQLVPLTPAPSWWGGYLTFSIYLQKHQQTLEQLHIAHQSRLKVSFCVDQERQQNDAIHELGQRVQRNLLDAKAVYEAFVLTADAECQRSFDQCTRIVAFNASMWMKAKLNAALTQYHQQLEAYLARLRTQQSNYPHHIKQPADTSSSPSGVHRATDLDLDQQDSTQHAAETRAVAIKRICHTVQEIHLLAVQLDTTVHANDAVIDRIDHQVIRSYQHVDNGNKNLEQADVYSHANGRLFLGCCGSMSLVIFVLLILVIKRYS